MARYLEEKDILDREQQESCSHSGSDAALHSLPPVQTKDKKNADKGRIVASVLLNV